ncbi:MAG TPA: hypothetical protein VFV38_08760 [Ktedonobacteraceae bacterium]|nr:hypothetical protein [Ktedonobacteraceae bacterium]
MTGFPRIALAIELALAITLSITWLSIMARQLYAKHWKHSHVQAPHYLENDTTLVLKVLQRIQTSYSDPANVSLADIQNVIQSLQQVHGEQATLEMVIQNIVGEQLRQQLRSRQALRRQKVLVAA